MGLNQIGDRSSANPGPLSEDVDNSPSFKFASPRQVPTLSLGSFISGTEIERATFSELLFNGMKDYGFVILRDHAINKNLLHLAYDLLEIFFALHLEVKMQYDASINGGQRGYTAFGKEHAKDSPVMDLKEFWHVGQELAEQHPYYSIYPKNVWPKELPEFREVMSNLYQSLEQTGQQMLTALTGPLSVSSEYFSQMTSGGNSILRLLHYPPIPEEVDPRCLRAAAHEDINLITLLVSASASGLQLKDRNGEWLDVNAGPDDIIVDAGDMLARITNDVIPATTHRVINSEEKNSHRYSMPFFMHPHPQAALSCLPSCRGDGSKYPDITAHDFLMQRLKEIGLT